mmetsp:Transcript_15141/g.42092  ORF Transcript_15141/g.42092 Transcript_15141/m.42092 type:complete len:439 (+) Transcript_15141:164-1480(+)|eukprot:CAMPEP_0172371504 /NCGR_PEP_ID=MMETSP1060-20121228/43195_1 /TAXON_ID=37318 /ORGANISM="Pseudo-nitzschia pungens, Strain cf. cingulata" /LENGTH=438 /DNA_ID=CAMNT_0013097147 /DNA_START=96 /DNA_END=1412 /DNA_ORIENTATION=+
MASGLAASIRGSTESDTFDLAGQTPATVSTNITQAFKDPFPIDDMIRITFVTGAGKLGRQKYDEGCAKAVTSSLRELGFEDDRAASCVRECAGLFKLQHDTGKNLKTVVVFPRIKDVSDSGGGDGNEGSPAEVGGNSLLLPSGSPEEMVASCPMNMFPNLVRNRCPSWNQKKGCNAAIANIQKLISNLEERLLEGVVLDDNEQTLYDTVSIDDLKEKHAIVKEAMQKQVETDGNITAEEQKQLLTQVSDRLETINADLEDAKAGNKPKKAEKLNNMKTKLEQRKAMLTKITSKPPAPLKYQKEILELHAELIPLKKLEESTKGRLLSVKETKTLARKDEILEEISQLENDSRGWFEDDASFELRVKKSRASGKQASKASSKKSSSGSSTKKNTTNAWITSSSTARRPAAKSYGKVGVAKKKPSGGGVFAAMMYDSDSD